ncbi:hypothetical protein [Leptothoe spongobia]|uniref:Uncharacterized protein n=1 Tax=Leptothoe spongobia TAU-MAC 1115 TaxID=1967444 RepID=A0A947DJC6_9CYAN|nr:hypothetical protein [Leptothoe spongobia]MBT9317294.1 hypothetical protein [Leptothoe spongobia TAU-MAC 1115]
MLNNEDFSKRRSNLVIENSTLIIIALSTAFFSRLLTYFGAPSPLNFFHFFAVLIVCGVVAYTSDIGDKEHIDIAGELAFGLLLLFICMVTSAIINNSGLINVLLQYLISAEPFILLLALVALPVNDRIFNKLKKWFLRFCFFNLFLALAQSVLIPAGIYPRRGGTIQDGIGGIFGGGGGSAANYISCTVSIYAALYFFTTCKSRPLWIRIGILLAAIYQAQVSDSKQVFLAFVVGGLILVLMNSVDPSKLLKYGIPTLLIIIIASWAYQNLDLAFLDAYKNWTRREGIFGLDGVATQTKIAAFPIVYSHYETPLNWFFGIGPGHSVTRLGGWMLEKYSSLLIPLGATIHPASAEVSQVVGSGWIAKESTIFFPLFTWAGLWGDFGFVGLAAYLYLGAIVWRRMCFNYMSKFLILSTVIFGFILTQMEEPGHMLTVAYILGLDLKEKVIVPDSNPLSS